MHSNKEEWPCFEICVTILWFICVHYAITDAHMIYGSATLLTNIRILSWKLPPNLLRATLKLNNVKYQRLNIFDIRTNISLELLGIEKRLFAHISLKNIES